MNITNRMIEVVDADTNNRRRISIVDDTETSTNYYLEYDNNMNFMDHHHRQQHHHQHQEEKGDNDDDENNNDSLIHLPLHNFEPTTDTTNNYRHRHHHYHQRRRAHSSHHRKLQEITGIATQYVNVYIGTPAQKRTLAISTGADFAAFPCQECTECGPTIPFYYQSLSSTYATIPCGKCAVGQLNAGTCDTARTKCNVEGDSLADDYSSWTAYEAQDYVYVGGADGEISKLNLGEDMTGSNVPKDFGFPLTFACQTKATGSFASQVEDGIIGFSTASTSFVNQMVHAGKLKRSVFALCCGRPEVVGNEIKGAGVLTLGGYDPRSPDMPLAYVQNVEQSPGNMYKVYVNNIYLREGGGRSVVPNEHDKTPVRLDMDAARFNERNGGALLDSGVPILILDESIKESFLLEWKKIVGSDFTLGDMFFFTEGDARRLPTVVLQIKAPDGVDKSFDPSTVPNMAGDLDPENPYDALMVIPAANYMEYSPGTGSYRVKIDLDGTDGAFIGMSAMQGHIFVYDVEQKRIGFAESSNCSPWDPNSVVETDDDMYTIVSTTKDKGDTAFDGGFPNGRGEKGRGDYGYGMGTCISATCISFVTVGYCIVVIVLAVAYKKYRPRDRSKQFDREIDPEDDTHERSSILFDPDRSVGSGGSSMRRFA